MPENPGIRVLVADDHAGFRHGLVALLASEPGVEVVGEALDGHEAVAMTLSLLPEVVLMDLQMPGLNGIEATRRVLAAAPHVGVLVLTMFEDDDSVVAAMRAGARGYVLKGAAPSEVVETLRRRGRGPLRAADSQQAHRVPAGARRGPLAGLPRADRPRDRPRARDPRPHRPRPR